MELPLLPVSALEDDLVWAAQGAKEFAWRKAKLKQKGKIEEEYSDRLTILPARVRAK
jgi:hypothetical protein